MIVRFAKNYSELLSAIASASSGDSIVLTSNTYTSASNLNISKSLNFEVDESLGPVTMTFVGSSFINITGSSGDNVLVNWSGDLTMVSAISLFLISSSIGTIRSSFSGLTFKDIGSSVVRLGASNSFDCIANFDNCIFKDTVSGIEVTNTGSGKSQVNLNRCTLDNMGTSFFPIEVKNNSVFTINNSTINSSVSASFLTVANSSVATISNTKITSSGNATILNQSSSGSTSIVNCTLEHTGVITGAIISITNGEFTANNSSFISTSTGKMITSPSGSGNVSLFDCKLTQTGNLSSSSLISFSGGTGKFVRCVIDGSGSIGSGSGTHYEIDATNLTNLILLGNVIINPEKTTGTVGSVLLPTGITAEISHNTFIRHGNSAAQNDGLYLNGDYKVRGNIFSGFDKALIPAGTSDYFYNNNSGYNVFYNNTTDIDGGIDFQSTDKPSISYDPFLDIVNKDFRLSLGTLANKLDPSDAKQIDYHQASINIFGDGTVSHTLNPDIDAFDVGPTDAGAYNNQNISYTITLKAEPDSGWFFGRFQGDEISVDNPYTFILTSSQVISSYFYTHVTPHLTSPKGGEIYNLGKVSITWDPNVPTAVFSSQSLSYDIEYTDSYRERNTNWYTLKRRIPWNTESFDWIVGKSIKSNSIRIRIRSRSINGTTSDWTMVGGDFSINVFKLIPPAIISPLPNRVYTDFILVILDETQLKDTFNQKVRYTLEYASEKAKINFTVIAKDVPVGQNVIRWNLEDVPPSDDYTLRLTVKNSSTCLEPQSKSSDQIAKLFVYNLKIQQPGMFLIDTVPPQAVLELENISGITNEITQVLNIFAEDATTEIKQIQLRECNTSNQLALGNVVNDNLGTTDCPNIESIISDTSDFNTIVGKPLGHSTKTQWTFKDESGTRQLEALLTDAGGNTSLQNLSRVFIPVFKSDESINDFIIVDEQRNEIVTGIDNNGSFVITETADFEVAYLGTSSGKYWVLEPFPRLIETLNKEILLLFHYLENVYLFTYMNTTSIPDTGSVYVDQKTLVKNIFTFNGLDNPKPNAVAEFMGVMYIGLDNGELWSYNGSVFLNIKAMGSPIRSLHGDENFLYIGLSNSSIISLYNGSDFFNSDVEP